MQSGIEYFNGSFVIMNLLVHKNTFLNFLNQFLQFLGLYYRSGIEWVGNHGSN